MDYYSSYNYKSISSEFERAYNTQTEADFGSRFDVNTETIGGLFDSLDQREVDPAVYARVIKGVEITTKSKHLVEVDIMVGKKWRELIERVGEDKLMELAKERLVSDQERQAVMLKRELKAETATSAIRSAFWQGASKIGSMVSSGAYNLGRTWFSTDVEWKRMKHQLSLDAMYGAVKNKESLLEGAPEGPLKEMAKRIFVDLAAKTDDPGGQHKTFLIDFRAALDSAEFRDGLLKKLEGGSFPVEVDILLSIAETRFTESHNYNFINSLVDMAIRAGVPEGAAVPEDEYEAVRKTPKQTGLFQATLGKIRGGVNINFDPHYQGNVPYTLYDFRMGGRPVRMLRFGVPTIETGPLSARINPEFRAFMQAYSFKGFKHLYINLQHQESLESNRCAKIRELHNDFPQTFLTVTMDQDSPWYKQEGEFAGLSDCNDFINRFSQQLFASEKTGYWFPEEWKADANFRSCLINCIQQSIEDLFGERSSLTAEERKIVIDDAHTRMQLFIVAYSGCDSVNLSCKDAIDRGGKESTKFFDFLMIMTGEGLNPKHIEGHRNLSIGPPFFVKKRGMIQSRLNRLKAHWSKIQQADPLARIQKRSAWFKIDPQTIDFLREPKSEISSR